MKERVPATIEERSLLRQPGAIMFVSCYELGHQPLGIAQPMGFLEQAGFAPVGLDIAVESMDESALRLARFVGISVPMHTALRLGVRVAELIRAMNPACHICFYGLYASINAEYLLQGLADSVVGGEYEVPLVSLIEALDRGQPITLLEGVSSRNRVVGPWLQRGYASTARRSRTQSQVAADSRCWTTMLGSSKMARSGWSGTSRPVVDASIAVSIARSCRSMMGASSWSRKPSS